MYSINSSELTVTHLKNGSSLVKKFKKIARYFIIYYFTVTSKVLTETDFGFKTSLINLTMDSLES